MIVKDYTGEIMNLKMKYAPELPGIPWNNVSLKISFPVLSTGNDWFVDLSLYRLFNRKFLRRLAYGVEANIYVTTISVSHPTFMNLEPSVADSAYIHAFMGPSLLFWIIPPEKRFFSSYTGCTFSYNYSDPGVTFQPFAGTRMFMDLNKAVNLEIRYTNYTADVVRYTFNPYGNAGRYKAGENFEKLSINLGIQVVF
jgi:hypothetical protein